MKYPVVELKKEVAPLVRQGFGWYYRSQLKRLPELPSGEIVQLELDRRVVGLGFYNRESQISVRLFHIGPPVEVTPSFWRERVLESFRLRKTLPLNSNGFRLLHGEGDLIPGVILDIYDRWGVIQFNTAGGERVREAILEGVKGLKGEGFQLEGVWEKRDPVRELEGLEVGEGFPLFGEVPERIGIWEGEFKFEVFPRGGQKTGFYLDQRENRRLIGKLPVNRVLDLFSHSGGFGIYLGRKGAQVTFVEISRGAVAQIHRHCQLNRIQNYTALNRDVFKFLEPVAQLKGGKGSRERGVEGELGEEKGVYRRYQLIVIDPPPFAKNRKGRKGALRGWKYLISNSLPLLERGGYLALFSCSHSITASDLRDLLLSSATSENRIVEEIAPLRQAPDHRYLPQFPSTLYLTGLLARVW
ncbi:MAG: class I SAM-dependent rRNA methyltransferase [Campylobacterales bacterium]